MVEHVNIPEAGLHEPKGVSTAQTGTVYIADGAGSGSWGDPIPTDLNRSGFVNYNDYATSITPQAISSSTWTKLTNDTLGPQTLEIYLPSSVTSMWDTVNNQFDFSELALGSMVEMRLDLTFTTASVNQFVDLRMVLGEGHASEYTVGIGSQHYKTISTYNKAIPFGMYIGNTLTKDNPGQLEIFSDDTLSVIINGWYIKVTVAAN